MEGCGVKVGVERQDVAVGNNRVDIGVLKRNAKLSSPVIMMNGIASKNLHVVATSEDLDNTRADVAAADDAQGLARQTVTDEACTLSPTALVGGDMGIAHATHGIEQDGDGTLGDRIALNERGNGRDEAASLFGSGDIDVVVTDTVTGKQDKITLVLEELLVEERSHRRDDNVKALESLSELSTTARAGNADALDLADLAETIHLIGETGAERRRVNDCDTVIHVLN